MDDDRARCASLPVPLLRVVDGVETPRQQRDLAYDLWTWTHNGNYRELARATGVAESTLRNWARKDDWRVRSVRDRLDLQPEDVRQATASILAAGGPAAAAYLNGVVEGVEPPDKNRITAAKILLDAQGFAPAHYSPDRDKPKPARVIPDDLSSLSTEELLALEAQFLEDDP